jgi:hypothetical protein
LVILKDYNQIIQTIYHDDGKSLEAVAFDEGSGKIATCSRSEVYIYKPYGKDEGALKVRIFPFSRGAKLMVLSGLSKALPVSIILMTLFIHSHGDQRRSYWPDLESYIFLLHQIH